MKKFYYTVFFNTYDDGEEQNGVKDITVYDMRNNEPYRVGSFDTNSEDLEEEVYVWIEEQGLDRDEEFEVNRL